jgi:hypothetical protein
MKASEIPQFRLNSTGLSSSSFNSPAAVVEHLGAVQSQDFAAAKWSVGLRLQKATDRTVEAAFNEGKFLRTHVMRPTWHFVMPKDIRWMLELTAPRVKRILAPYDCKLGITPEVLIASQRVFTKALEGKNYLNRTELGNQLEANGLSARGQRLAHLIMHSEIEGLICSGPRRGKQFTYGLLEEVAPNAKKLPQEDAQEKLALKYFRGHGPAQLVDFAWWSGLAMKDARQGLDKARTALTEETVEGKTYWFSQKTNAVTYTKLEAYLLSIYDEYVIGYKDRSALGEGRYFEELIQMGNALTAVMVLDGRIVGTWKRRIGKDQVEIRLNPFMDLDAQEREEFEKSADRYSAFTESPTIVTYT